MIKSEAEEVIERIRQDLEKHGVTIGFVQEVTIPYFGCDLDHYVAQVSEAPGNLVKRILIHDEALWRVFRRGDVPRCKISECQCRGELFGMPIMIEPRTDDSYTILYNNGQTGF